MFQFHRPNLLVFTQFRFIRFWCFVPPRQQQAADTLCFRAVRLSVRPSVVRLSVRPSVRPSVRCSLTPISRDVIYLYLLEGFQ